MEQIFLRSLGFIFFIAHGAFLLQAKGLIGENGILPLASHIRKLKERGFKIPCLFWFNASDRFILGTLSISVIASIFLMLGIFSPIMLLILCTVHLSLIYAGQDFMSFGWELFLMEIGVNAFFLSLGSNPMILLSLNFLLFRFHFKAGVVKLQSRDRSWRNLTAIFHHYQSQPLPNTTSWFAYKLPMWFHKLSCLYMYFVELIVPFGMLFGETARLFVLSQFVLLQGFIWLTGNFSYLNYLTVAFALILLPMQTPAETPIALDAFLYILGSLLVTLQLVRTVDHFFPRVAFRRILTQVSPYFIGNRYGIFAVMTIQRVEIVIEGSNDGVVWKEYVFKYKPSEVSWRPRRISPYQPRLDWQAWFLPFGLFEQEFWFHRFMECILRGKKDVLGLIRENPFPDKPPRHLRALSYDYKFTTWQEKKETGNWWKRKLLGEYSPIVSLRE